MRNDMRTIRFYGRGRTKILHVETDLGIVNVRVGLTDRHGRPVTVVETIPDRFVGEPKVLHYGSKVVRFVQRKGRW